jgi:hypothetical protein
MLLEDRDDSPTPGGAQAWGAFTGGIFAQVGVDEGSVNWARILTSTATSYLAYDWAADCDSPGPYCGYWGILKNGIFESPTDSTQDFAYWDLIAGTASSLLSYRRSDGTSARATLKNGVYDYVGPGPTLAAGWRIIVGGR